MTQQNITSLQEIMIRRLSRAFQIERRGNRLTARLPVFSPETVTQNIQHKVYYKVLTVENTPNGVRVEYYDQTVWKRLYWHKWRHSKENNFVITGTNFNKLVSEVRERIEIQ